MRMLLSRELSPRYSRLSPETANVFDNLHMLHGITYDIFAYDGWTVKEKRAELYRVLDAMSYQSGDEKWVRKFELSKPDVNPLDYDAWSQDSDGEMTRMMLEMLDEMMPMMMANHHSTVQQGNDTHHKMPKEKDSEMMDHSGMSHMEHAQMMKHQEMTSEHHSGSHHSSMHQKLKEQLHLKLTPGIQDGELSGSFMDAMMQLMPQMHMNHDGMEAGQINPMMVNTMLKGWQDKYSDLPDVAVMPMDTEPSGIR